jgi:tripeptide aminopeptidase
MNIAQYINKDRLIQTFGELLRINSPSFNEHEIGEVLASRLADAGFQAERREYGKSFNLVAVKKGINNAPPLLLSAHMDTIEPTEGISFNIEQDAIRTTGNTVLGADDKSAIAQIIEAATVLHENNIPHGDVEIAFTSAEEKGLHGARNLDLSKIKSRHALVLDSSGSVGRIVIAAPTHITYEMSVTGRPAHAGIEPEKGINAIRAAAEIISNIPDGRIDSETTANIGIITGGTATNVVPKEVVIHGELRGHSAGAINKLKKTIFDIAKQTAARHHAMIHISEFEEYRSFKINKDEPFLKYLDGIYKNCGIETAHVTTGGGSDANIFNEKGITSINISNGMQNVHSTEEFITIQDLYNGCLIVLQSVAGFNKFLR